MPSPRDRALTAYRMSKEQGRQAAERYDRALCDRAWEFVTHRLGDDVSVVGESPPGKGCWRFTILGLPGVAFEYEERPSAITPKRLTIIVPDDRSWWRRWYEKVLNGRPRQLVRRHWVQSWADIGAYLTEHEL